MYHRRSLRVFENADIVPKNESVAWPDHFRQSPKEAQDAARFVAKFFPVPVDRDRIL